MSDNQKTFVDKYIQEQSNKKLTFLDNKIFMFSLKFILPIPIAILSYLIILIPLIICTLGMGDWTCQILHSIIGSYFFIYVGSCATFSYSKKTSILLLSIFILFCIFSVYALFLYNNSTIFIWNLFCILVSTISAIIAYIQFNKNIVNSNKYKRKKLLKYTFTFLFFIAFAYAFIVNFLNDAMLAKATLGVIGIGIFLLFLPFFMIIMPIYLICVNFHQNWMVLANNILMIVWWFAFISTLSINLENVDKEFVN